jgi:DNA polymerase-3 subunit gamma/tau
MSQALYRKYRSRALSEVVGQRHITDVLEKALAQKRIGHAFLFTGPRGTGKTSIARILAHAINDAPYTNDTHHLDIIEIDAASNRRIDDIRDLREKVHSAPTSAPYKVYIIDEVHMLTGESFNALLKTLEEPPAHVIFILATTEVHKLPATIISRTQRFHFRLIPEAEVVAHLQYIAQQEKVKINNDALHLIAQHGEGSFRDSISLLDQLSSLAGNDPITAQMVETTLGLAPHERVKQLLEATLKHDLAATIALISQLEEAGVSPGVLVGQLMQALRTEQPTAAAFELIEALLDVPRSHNPHMKLLAVLARFASQKSTIAHQRAVALAVSAVPAVSAPVLKSPKSSSLEHTPSSPAPSKTPEPHHIAAQPIEGFDWQTIMNLVRERHIPLYGVLGHAKSHYADGILTLYFNYGLHRKKIDDSKYRTLLSAIVAEIYGNCPEIVTTVGKAPLQDSVAASVAAVMGGGEEVNV